MELSKTIQKFIRPPSNSVFECHNLHGIKFLVSLNPLCKCGFEVESTSHFLLHCPIYNNYWFSLLSTIKNIGCKLLENTKRLFFDSNITIWKSIS